MTLALALALAAVPSDTTWATCLDPIVLDRDDLEAGGVVTVHDVLRLVPGLDAVSVDGYDAEPLVAWGSPRPAHLVVDGVPVATTAAVEPLGIEPLPVAVGEIERVVVCDGPGYVSGAWGGPWVAIETAPPGRAYAAGVYGNETGDPGPDLYTDPALPNVDRWGPDAEAVLGVRAGRGRIWGSLRAHRLLPTDTSIAPRIYPVAVPGQNPTRLGTSAGLSATRPGVRVRFGAHGASDLPFVPALGREMPANRRVLQGSARAERAGVRGHVHVARLDLGRPDGSRLPVGPGDAGPAWTEHRVDAAASVYRGGRQWALSAGVQGGVTHAEGPGLDAVIGAGRLWGHARRSEGRAEERLALQLSASDGRALLGGFASVRRPLGVGADATLTLALDRQPPSPRNPGVWLRRGYTGLRLESVTVIAGPEAPSAVAAARLGVRVRLPAGAVFHLRAEGQAGETTVERVDLRQGREAVEGAVRYGSASGTAGALAVRGSWAGGQWATSVSGRLRRAFSGDVGHRDAWARVPRAEAVVRLAVRPDARLVLWGAVRVRSGARWSGYPNPEVPAAVLADVGVVKRAWAEHVEVAVVGRNVLDAPERTHPLGAVLAPRLFVRLAVRL